MSRKKWSSEKIYLRLLTNKSKRTYWDNIIELRNRPNEEVFNKAFELAKSEVENEKIIGINVLAQLGGDSRPFFKETMTLYFELLEKKQSSRVITSLLYGIGHNNEALSEEQISKLSRFRTSKSSENRHALVFALLGNERQLVIDVLMELMNDKSIPVRNWVTFGIGTQIEVDNKGIRAALWSRVNDKHEETRFEAIVGLANRKDVQISEVIKTELQKGDYGTLLFDAICTLNSKEFLPLLEEKLQEIKKESGVNEVWVEELKRSVKQLR